MKTDEQKIKAFPPESHLWSQPIGGASLKSIKLMLKNQIVKKSFTQSNISKISQTVKN